MHSVAKLLVVLAASLVTVGCQSQGSMADFRTAGLMTPAGLPQSSSMPAGLDAENPPGFASFCLRHADQCSTSPDAPTALPLNTALAAKLSQVNESVNRAIWPKDDAKHYGRPEYWTIPTDGYGDCDDYAVTKRAQLIAAGYPASTLRLAVAVTPRVVRHAVLTVATDQGDYVLDNLHDRILPWNATGYQWLMRQKTDDTRRWVSLQNPVTDGSRILTASIAPTR